MTRTRNFVAVLRPGEGSSYGVEFPDFPGCISAGNTLSEAVANAKEALALHVRGLLADGQKLPTPCLVLAITLESHAEA